ncbi:MAG: hypothetical protein F8N37_24985 [Telmatospirillum sp.]|nr:hypothetical protein [Telmatospirillum sp.]
MYDRSDPRSALAAQSPSATAATEFAGAEYGRFYRDPPQIAGAEGKSWYLRGQNFVLGYHETLPGAVLSRSGQADEYVVLVPDRGLRVEVSANGETRTVAGGALIVVPAGDSALRLPDGGRVVRLLTVLAEDLVAMASNAASYATRHPNIPPFAPWPAAPGEPRIRAYSIDVPAEEGRFGRIFRCSTFMVNFLDPYVGPRDATKMSPHAHDDFEQCSLALEGSFTHYIRWPWTTNLNVWREDDREVCDAPSVAVIPPPAIHTSRATADGINLLVDIFCPPRADFSARPGWVLNAGDYPLPEQA